MRYVSIFSLPIPKHRDRKMKAILNHFFRECPDAPLTNLYRILEEDILEEDTYYNPKMSGTSRGPGSRKWSNKVLISENVSTYRQLDNDMQNNQPMPTSKGPFASASLAAELSRSSLYTNHPPQSTD